MATNPENQPEAQGVTTRGRAAAQQGAAPHAQGTAATEPTALETAVPQPMIARILLSPWEGDIDLSNKTGKALWDEGIKPLQTKFNGQSAELVRFLADVKNHAHKCYWDEILTFNGKYLLTHYGEISLDIIKQAKTSRNSTMVTTLASARPRINALMMYHFLYNSLGEVPQKKLTTHLDTLQQDGPMLLKFILDNTHVASQATTFAIKEKLLDLNLKYYKNDVQALNQDVRQKMVELIAAGHPPDRTDMIITLFRAYQGATNEDFKSAVSYWKNEWNARVWEDPQDLMLKADAKYSELNDLGTWNKRSVKDEQIIALTTKIEELIKTQSTKSNFKGKESSNMKDNKAARWKYDRSVTTSEEYSRNGKTYRWCTGPGHNETPMWVLHEPGQCTGIKVKSATQAKEIKKSEKPHALDRQSLVAALEDQGHFTSDEIASKVEAILAVMES